MTADSHFARMDAARVLAFGGIALLVCGMLAGEIYAIYISHVANGLIRQNWQGVVSAVADADMDALTGHFRVIQDLSEKRGRTMNTHSHVAAYGLLALLLAHLQPYLALRFAGRRKVAVLYLAGAVLHFGAVYLSYYVDDRFLYAGDIGALMVLAACGATALALWSAGSDAPKMEERLKKQLRPASSRYLLKSGVLLIIAGMVFGVFYAWILVSQDEPAVYASINDATEHLAVADVEASREAITAFKRAQSKIAITAAAHSHAIEFGFLMLLLALLQRYVLLSDRWRLAWARLLSVGAWLLPVCVFLATLYGLRAAAFADIFGGMVLVALIAMGFGIIRYTGSADQESARTAT